MIKYQILATGSKGNAVVINDCILIDCGVPFKALRGVYAGLKLVLLTHIHGDHFNATTIRTLAEHRPTLRFGCCEWLVQPLLDCGIAKRQIDVYDHTGKVWMHYEAGFNIGANEIVHDVRNCAYHLQVKENSLFYATDTNSMCGIKAKGYDLYMLEANYTESDMLKRIRMKHDSGGFVYEYRAMQNHLSREKADNWLYENMGANSCYIYMHEHGNGGNEY